MDSVPGITTRGGGKNTNLKYEKAAITLFSYRYDTETNNSRDYKLLFSCQPLDYFDKYPFSPFCGNNFKELRDKEESNLFFTEKTEIEESEKKKTKRI